MLWQRNKCIYGLVDAPRCFYLRLREVLNESGASVSQLDEALFFVHDKNGHLIGVIACHVDDLLYCGTFQFHHEVVNNLRDKLEFGSENSFAFTYIGMHVQQHQNHTISLDQLSFTDSIAPISIPKARFAADKQSKLTAQETIQLRAAIHQLNWIATASQPQISFEVCQASTRVKEATLADLIHINKVITKVQRE